ncbi:MAG: prepilin-type N-terminal cleavage/methylation domain-containing protein [Planctomycetes bacterium]|nr:prepilin-type N-terminal cleavage/methylation domain-containing protein [Planctomycetota bacterium]
MNKRDSGMTLLEVMIAAAIFAAMLIPIFYLFSRGQEMYHHGTVQSVLETEAIWLLDLITDDIPECRIVTAPTTPTNHAILTIQMPVVSGTSYWDNNGSIYWGADWMQDWTITYQFETDSNSTLDETVALKDYNKDNDLNDKFAVGKIVRIIRNDVGVELISLRSVKGHNIIVNWNGDTLAGYDPVANYYGFDLDVTGDGVPDPLFSRFDRLNNENIVRGNRIKFNFSFYKEGAKGEPVFVNERTGAKLINPQQ